MKNYFPISISHKLDQYYFIFETFKRKLYLTNIKEIFFTLSPYLDSNSKDQSGIISYESPEKLEEFFKLIF